MFRSFSAMAMAIHRIDGDTSEPGRIYVNNDTESNTVTPP
jgi:hypothetical protein